MTRAEAEEKAREAWQRIAGEWDGSAKGYEDAEIEVDEVLAALVPTPSLERVLQLVDEVCRDDLSDYYGDVRERLRERIGAEYLQRRQPVVLEPGTDEARRAAYAIEDGSAQPWAFPWKDELAALARRLRGEQ